MSRTENHIGKVKEICIDQKGFEDKYKYAINNHDLERDSDDDEGYMEDRRFLYIEDLDKMFIIVENIEDECGHCVVKSVGDNEYEYILSFYNGGGGFAEVFESNFKSQIISKD